MQISDRISKSSDSGGGELILLVVLPDLGGPTIDSVTGTDGPGGD